MRNISRSWHKCIANKKEMINLREFEEKLSLTERFHVKFYLIKCSVKKKLKGKVVYFFVLSAEVYYLFTICCRCLCSST